MDDAARFTSAPARAGMYESFYLRAVDPAAPVGLWARYTVRKAPGEAPVGSVWCTVFDGALGAPYTHKVSTPDPAAPPGRWIRIDSHGALSPREASGECGAAWSLEMRASSPSLSHLSPSILYRLPLPRTKPTSPAPTATRNFSQPDQPKLTTTKR